MQSTYIRAFITKGLVSAIGITGNVTHRADGWHRLRCAFLNNTELKVKVNLKIILTVVVIVAHEYAHEWGGGYAGGD
jgi:hypothetical protein